MAITKLMHMKSAKSGSASGHLKNAIDYILQEKKVAISEGIKMCGSKGCILSNAYNDMMRTKRQYGKTDGRQGYHFVISFRPGEATKEQLWNITQDFVEEYLTDYEVVYAIHDDAKHLHAHIIFNSVSYRTGYKYHYANGEWEKNIQPLVDRLCIENGLPPLEYHVDEYENDRDTRSYTQYSKSMNWKKIIKLDIDECINNSKNWEDFIEEMKKLDYRINFNKYMTVKRQEMGKARRLTEKQMGYAYTPEGIITRIKIKNRDIRVRNAAPDIKESVKLKQESRIKHKYKKYKDMTFEEKVKIRHMLRIKNAIPDLKAYPGSFLSARKVNELHRVEQELIVTKKYQIHNADDMSNVLDKLDDKKKEINAAKKQQEFLKGEYKELTDCIGIIDKYEQSYSNSLNDNGNNDKRLNDDSYDASGLIKVTEEDYVNAKEKLEQLGETEASVRKFINDCNKNDKTFKTELKNIRRQKAAIKRIQNDSKQNDKHEKKSDQRSKNTNERKVKNG